MGSRYLNNRIPSNERPVCMILHIRPESCRTLESYKAMRSNVRLNVKKKRKFFSRHFLWLCNKASRQARMRQKLSSVLAQALLDNSKYLPSSKYVPYADNAASHHWQNKTSLLTYSYYNNGPYHC